MIRSYLPAIVFLLLGAGLGAVFAMINTFLGPRKRRHARATAEPYESGLPSEVKKSMRFGISFYLVAMLFILFDIETIFLSGRISIKMAPVIRRLYDQMLEPRYVIAMGACSSSMGVFNNYALVPGDKFLPVDVHVPGCPPRPESLVHGILKLRAAILAHPDEGWRTRYGGRGTEEVVAGLEREDPDAIHAINVSGGTGGADPNA